jgi:Reverse transcriptase (RNA-dependent DNA polymerase).
VPIEDNKCLFPLNYADDQVKIAQDADDLEFILKRLNKAYREGGLTINFNKTEFIAIRTDQEFHINIEENVRIKQVQNFKYLGVSLNKKGINLKDSVNKICKGRQITGCLNSKWWNKNIPLDTKMWLGKAMVESVACYACEA